MDKKSSAQTVGWWVGWILLTILSFFASCYFWTGFIAKHVGSMKDPKVPILWVTAVFGSWLILLIPLIIVMYYKVDKAYEDARIERDKKRQSQTQRNDSFKSIFIEDSKRLLSKPLVEKIKRFPETIRQGHLVTATLRDGKKIDHVFVFDKKDVLGVYGVKQLSFQIDEIVDIEPADLDRLPDFRTENWLRLDGA